jgi:hypothetical protein
MVKTTPCCCSLADGPVLVVALTDTLTLTHTLSEHPTVLAGHAGSPAAVFLRGGHVTMHFQTMEQYGIPGDKLLVAKPAFTHVIVSPLRTEHR